MEGEDEAENMNNNNIDQQTNRLSEGKCYIEGMYITCPLFLTSIPTINDVLVLWLTHWGIGPPDHVTHKCELLLSKPNSQRKSISLPITKKPKKDTTRREKDTVSSMLAYGRGETRHIQWRGAWYYAVNAFPKQIRSRQALKVLERWSPHRALRSGSNSSK